MSGAIYVLSWSTGALKVGRSDRPVERIEQHKQAARVFGVSLLEQHAVACSDSVFGDSQFDEQSRV